MPCDASYMEPNHIELNSKIVCQHLVYVHTELGNEVPTTIAEAAGAFYGLGQDQQALDRATAQLCSLIRGMSEEQLDRIVYNGRDSRARALADWWDVHQKADENREEELLAKAKKKVVSVVEVTIDGVVNNIVAFSDDDDGNAAAELLFKKLLKETTDIKAEDYDSYLDDGYAEVSDGGSIQIVHSV